MKPKIVIFGAGGHTRTLIPLVRSEGYDILAIYDDSFKNGVDEKIDGISVIGKIDDFKKEAKIILSYGEGEKRNMLINKFPDYILNDNLIHPSAIIENSAKIEGLNQIFALVVINAQTIIGKNNIINTGAIIEHEVKIGGNNHISVGSVLAGMVEIGDYCFIGAGAVIIDKVKITDKVIIGANAVVIKNINEPGTYVGNPARKIK